MRQRDPEKAAMINEGNPFRGDRFLHGSKALMEGQCLTGTDTRKQMSSRHENPKSADPQSRADLILVESEILFRLTKENLNRPAHQIRVQDLLRSERSICADKSTQGAGYAKGIFRKRDEDNSIFQIFQISHIAIYIILPFANGNEADFRGSFMDKRSELGNLLLDTSWKNKSVCFERTNRIEALGKKGIHYFCAAVPTIAQEKRGSRSFREFLYNITRDLNFGPRFVI